MSKPYMCGDDSPIYIPTGGCDCNYTLQRVESDELEGLYYLMLNGERVGDPVEVPKDKYIKSGEVRTVLYPDNPYEGAVVGDKYFLITLENTDQKVYIPLGPLDLSNYYTKEEVDALIPEIGSCDIYPVGSVVITSTNDNPGSYLCGEWELIDKEFTPYGGRPVIEWASSTQGSEEANTRVCSVFRSGHSINIRLWWQNRADYEQNVAYTVCLIPYSVLGLTGTYQHFPIAHTHTSSNAVCTARFENSDPIEVLLTGFVANGSLTRLASGQSFYIEVTHIASLTNMSDSACNKFYWRRIPDSDSEK